MVSLREKAPHGSDGIASRRSGFATTSAYVLAFSCVAAVGGFLFGFDSGVVNGAVDPEAMLSFFFVWAAVRENRGRALEEM